MKNKSASKIRIDSFDDLFSGKDNLVEIPLSNLHTFRNHPFRVVDDDSMMELAESIRQKGVLNPAIVRRDPAGYEILSGHRRKRACEIAGLSAMPCVVFDCSDDEAAVIMVDSNIQREEILPSEKARAYRMKYDALKHQGVKTGNAESETSLDMIGEAAGESGKTVQRYIRLSYLVDELLDFVDEGLIGVVQGVDISYLPEQEQKWIVEEINRSHVRISREQSAKLKDYGEKNELTRAMVELILSEKKPPERKVVIRGDRLSDYFPEGTAVEDIEAVIYQLLDEWKSAR